MAGLRAVQASERTFESRVVDELPSRITMMPFLKDETGATSVEYTLMAALIAAVVFAAAQTLGAAAQNVFTVAAGLLTGAGS